MQKCGIRGDIRRSGAREMINEKRGAEGAAFLPISRENGRQLAAAVVTVSRWRFMTILLSAPR